MFAACGDAREHTDWLCLIAATKILTLPKAALKPSQHKGPAVSGAGGFSQGHADCAGLCLQCKQVLCYFGLSRISSRYKTSFLFFLERAKLWSQKINADAALKLLARAEQPSWRAQLWMELLWLYLFIYICFRKHLYFDIPMHQIQCWGYQAIQRWGDKAIPEQGLLRYHTHWVLHPTSSPWAILPTQRHPIRFQDENLSIK